MLSPNEIQKLLNSSLAFIEQYSALMMLSPNVAPNVTYSGTFVSCFGYVGILTAGHCAAALMESSGFYLVTKEHAHGIEVQPKQVLHLRIGYNEAEGYALSEPDLSFFIIKDRRILNTLTARSQFFYEMSKLKIRDTGLVEGKFNHNNWIIAGNAAEDAKTRAVVINGQSKKFIMVAGSIIKGNFADHDLIADYGYDYVKIKVISGSRGFPDSYSGVSGGGIWYIKLVTTATGEQVLKPFLVGVACWQSKPTIGQERSERIISGHGWVSVYGHFRRVLFDKFQADKLANRNPIEP